MSRTTCFTLERRLKQFLDPEITSAGNGRVALEKLRAQPFDLVLLDVQMPEMDGVAALEQMKSDMSLREVPVIMVSAVDDFKPCSAASSLAPTTTCRSRSTRISCGPASKPRSSANGCVIRRAFLSSSSGKRRPAWTSSCTASCPKAIVSELKTNARPQAKRHEDVAVLFCDIVGFTEYCERNPPEQVVAELETLVGSFEEIVEAHGLEKIKTIGDAFMATAGLIHYVENPALSAAECGLAMVDAANKHPSGWHVRVGVHQGPVVAGIMGQRSFVFDLWGDTVNVAARVAAEAEPDAVVVTGTMWPFLSKTCHGRALGIVDLRGKGKTELVRYVGRR